MKNKVKDISCVKGFDILKKSFDNVILENLETHQTLEISNNVSKNGIDKVVYLKLNISYSGSGGRGPKECLEGAIDDMLPWLDLLINHDEKDIKKSTQLSLFDDNSSGIELEPEPEHPTKDSGWDKYFRDREKVRLSNLKKEYSFFELFDPLCWWWTYHSFDYKKFIPTHEQMLSIVKEKICKYKDGDGRYKDAWFDNAKSINGKAISDIELYNKVMNRLRVYIAPWIVHSGPMLDDSYTKHLEKSTKESYLFYFGGGRLDLNYSALRNSINIENKYKFGQLQDKLQSYDFYTPEFISFLRETFNADKKEPLNDNSAREILLKSFAKSIKSSWESELNNSSSYKEFKSRLLNGIKQNDIQMKHEPLSEDYSFVMNFVKGVPHLRIEQRTNTRIKLGYEFDKSADIDWWKYIVEFIEGDEVYKQIFNLYKTSTIPKIIQTSLFDFLGAA